MKAKWLDRALVIAPVHYTIATNIDIFNDILKHLKMTPESDPLKEYTDARTNFYKYVGDDRNSPKITAVVYMPAELAKQRTMHAVYGLIVHEAMHIWREIKDILGESDPSSEFEAYSMQWIAHELMVEYDRQVGITHTYKEGT